MPNSRNQRDASQMTPQKMNLKSRYINNMLASALILLLVALSLPSATTAFTSTATATTNTINSKNNVLNSVSPDTSAEDALARTKSHLEKLKQRSNSAPVQKIVSKRTGDDDNEDGDDDDLHPQQQQSIAVETMYRQYILQSANLLKTDLKSRQLNTKGRKPDLARRLARHDLALAEAEASGLTDMDSAVEPVALTSSTAVNNGKKSDTADSTEATEIEDFDASFQYPVNFAGLPLSETAASALHQAGFLKSPSPIQSASLSAMANGESVLLHAPTGSGKTIAYTLPVTEYFWHSGDTDGVSLIVTPTRELATQVAGVISALAPPGSVRLIAHPSNLVTDGSKERRDRESKGGRPQIIVGSAKTLVASLYGNDKYPASPTPKPAALEFLKSVRTLVLDEVDRLLGVQGSKHAANNKKHEKPAAVLAAAVARHTLGRAQVVAASATVGRPLKRELARVLGLPPPKGPRVIVAQDTIVESNTVASSPKKQKPSKNGAVPASSRLVTIPYTVEHFIAAVTPKDDDDNNGDSSISSGQLLIQAYKVIQEAVQQNPKARILLVLTRGFGISTQHVIGALEHFQCKPEPISLLDALQNNALGTDHLMEKHEEVSGATGVGQKDGDTENTSSLWVTGEDTIRGLHLDGLDVVVMVGRPRGPDEYTHIAGRTGRAAKSGKVVAVVSKEQAPTLKGWETMLQMQWQVYQKPE